MSAISPPSSPFRFPKDIKAVQSFSKDGIRIEAHEDHAIINVKNGRKYRVKLEVLRPDLDTSKLTKDHWIAIAESVVLMLKKKNVLENPQRTPTKIDDQGVHASLKNRVKRIPHEHYSGRGGGAQATDKNFKDLAQFIYGAICPADQLDGTPPATPRRLGHQDRDRLVAEDENKSPRASPRGAGALDSPRLVDERPEYEQAARDRSGVGRGAGLPPLDVEDGEEAEVGGAPSPLAVGVARDKEVELEDDNEGDEAEGDVGSPMAAAMARHEHIEVEDDNEGDEAEGDVGAPIAAAMARHEHIEVEADNEGDEAEVEDSDSPLAAGIARQEDVEVEEDNEGDEAEGDVGSPMAQQEYAENDDEIVDIVIKLPPALQSALASPRAAIRPMINVDDRSKQAAPGINPRQEAVVQRGPPAIDRSPVAKFDPMAAREGSALILSGLPPAYHQMRHPLFIEMDSVPTARTRGLPVQFMIERDSNQQISGIWVKQATLRQLLENPIVAKAALLALHHDRAQADSRTLTVSGKKAHAREQYKNLRQRVKIDHQPDSILAEIFANKRDPLALLKSTPTALTTTTSSDAGIRISYSQFKNFMRALHINGFQSFMEMEQASKGSVQVRQIQHLGSGLSGATRVRQQVMPLLMPPTPRVRMGAAAKKLPQPPALVGRVVPIPSSVAVLRRNPSIYSGRYLLRESQSRPIFGPEAAVPASAQRELPHEQPQPALRAGVVEPIVAQARQVVDQQQEQPALRAASVADRIPAQASPVDQPQVVPIIAGAVAEPIVVPVRAAVVNQPRERLDLRRSIVAGHATVRPGRDQAGQLQPQPAPRGGRGAARPASNSYQSFSGAGVFGAGFRAQSGQNRKNRQDQKGCVVS